MKIIYAVVMGALAVSAWGQQAQQQARQQARQQAAQQAQPQGPTQMTVSELKDYCAAKDAGGKNACRFYILGVAQGVELGAGEARDQTHFCIPEGLAPEDLVTVVKRAMDRYLTAYPMNANKQAVALVGAAMMQAYPCRR